MVGSAGLIFDCVIKEELEHRRDWVIVANRAASLQQNIVQRFAVGRILECLEAPMDQNPRNLRRYAGGSPERRAVADSGSRSHHRRYQYDRFARSAL